MNKKVTKKIAIALCGVALTGAAMPVIANKNIQTVSANNQGTRVWIQYGTLKYDLRGPSGKIYKAGTKVARITYQNEQPPKSAPNAPFYLTLIIGGRPGANNLTDAGGGSISETFVNAGEWTEQDYPPESVALVNNTMDDNELKSSDFHPVDGSNPDVAHANVDALKTAFANFCGINVSKLSAEDQKIGKKVFDMYYAGIAIGTSQEVVDSTTAYINNVVDAYKKTGHLTGAADNTGTTKPDTEKPSSGDTTTTNPAHAHNVILHRAAYQYTHKGKRVSKKRLPKGAVVKINGKVYRIKGKAYYRVAKNRYIRVATVEK